MRLLQEEKKKMQEQVAAAQKTASEWERQHRQAVDDADNTLQVSSAVCSAHAVACSAQFACMHALCN